MNYSGKKPKQTRCQIAHVKDVEFSVASEQLINNMSVMEISQPKLFSNSYTLKGSPNDLRLGIGYTDEKCETCSQRQQCQGHIGHIKLEHPVYHYGYFDQISKILSCVCHNCFKVKRPKDRESRKQFLATSQLQSNRDKLKHMYKICNKLVICHQSTQEDQRAHELFRNFKGCGYKKNPKKVIRKNYQIFWDQSGSKNIGKFMKPYSRSYVQQFLQRLSCFQQECQLLGFTTTKPINLMIKSLIVIPPQARPSLDINSQIRYEDDITRTYCKIININKSLKEKTNKLTPLQREQLIEDIEHLTASLMFKLKSSVINRNRVRNLKKRKRIQNFKTISDRLDGKQGRFRQNLMGKRVDYSARSVISPDPNLDLDQIGVPVKIARKLTFPQEINQLNYDKIINLCMMGKVKTLIQPPQQSLRNDNRVINMQKLLGEPRQEIQKYVNYGMIAERALEDGDYVILNRQPTLHRMSMMSHKVKILPYNTFRINLSVCTPYNADFDGDQMNIHVPQSYESLAQIKKISAVPKQIVAPKNSTPIMGIVQDALLGAFLFTLKDNFLNRQEVMNLLMHLQTNQYNSEFQEKLFNLPYPAIIEPQELWTGKQVMSILMPKNLTIKHIKNKSQNLSNLSDLNLIIKNGQILTGCLQKDTMGFSAGSMIHSIWLESGSKAASIFITNTQKVINNWMLQNSFSIGASDIVPKPELQTEINKQKNYLQKLYFRTLSKYMNANQVQRQNLHQRGKKILNSFQFNINTQLNSRLAKTQQIIRNNLTRLENNIFTIVQAKSKGSETNLSQIMFSVGNQNVNGMRCPLGFSKRALPHFCKDDHSPQPRGYIFSSFYSGLKPHEFFFHSMGGRQGLSDTAVKTSHVGYIQRKLVKALQDIVVKYDGTVRDSRNNLLQKFYGQDGFLPEYLQKHRIVGAQMSKQAFRKRYKWQHKQLVTVYGYGPQKIHKLRQQYSCLYYYRKRLRKIYIENQESTALQYYCPIKVDRIINKINSQSKRNTQKKYDQDQYESIGPLEIFQKVQRLINQCVPPLAQYLDKLFKSKIAVQILQDGDSMSEEQQQQKILVKGQINNTTLIKQQRSLLNATDMNLLKEHNKKKYADNFEQQLGLQVFHIHLWYNLSSRNLIKKHKITRTTFQSLLKQIKKKFHQSLAPAGQSVGALAAQSIGQPTTQMTLNTFHLAGVSQKNVTLGLPRLQQLLDISKNIKTPSMTIFPKRKIFHSERTKIQNQSYLLDYLTYYLPQRKVDDFLESSKLVYQIRKTIKKDDNQIGPLQSPWGIVLIFNWRKFSSKKYWIQIMYQIQNYIQRNVKQYYKVIEQKQFNDTVQKIQNPELLIKYMQPLSSITKQLINQQETGQNQQIAHKKSHIHTNQEDQIQCEIFNNLDKLENDIRNLSICGIKGIKSAKTSKKTILNIPKMHPLSLYANNEPLKLKSELTVFQSDGTNLRACLSHPQIDPIKTYTNDVYQISQILGIQAARQAFLNQLRDILAPYGIFINIRHLTILVDWICMRGQMSAINRYGINRAKDASICKKASYQQSTKILLQSAVFSEHDYLAGVSERILFGEAIRSGSNMFNLMLDLDKVGDYSSKAQFDKKKNLTQNGYGLNLDQTPEYYSPNQSLLRANNSISRLGSLHSPDISMNFSPVNSFLNSPQIKFNSPTYIKQQKINSLSDTNSFNSLNLSSNQSPSYIQNRINSLNSTIYKSSPKYINDYSSQKINNSNPAPSPIYRTQPVLKKQISKVEQDQFQDQSYQDF